MKHVLIGFFLCCALILSGSPLIVHAAQSGPSAGEQEMESPDKKDGLKRKDGKPGETQERSKRGKDGNRDKGKDKKETSRDKPKEPRKSKDEPNKKDKRDRVNGKGKPDNKQARDDRNGKKSSDKRNDQPGDSKQI